MFQFLLILAAASGPSLLQAKPLPQGYFSRSFYEEAHGTRGGNELPQLNKFRPSGGGYVQLPSSPHIRDEATRILGEQEFVVEEITGED